MKKIILSATAIFAFAFNSAAQDLMFETWSAAAPPFATILDPSGWATLNALNLVGTDTSVFKETVAPGQGLISAKIKTVKVIKTFSEHSLTLQANIRAIFIKIIKLNQRMKIIFFKRLNNRIPHLFY